MKHLDPRELAANSAPLHQILNLAGAHNWTPEQIEAHKAHELAKAPPPSWAGRHFYAIQAVYDFGHYVLVPLVVSVMGMLVGAVGSGILWLGSFAGLSTTPPTTMLFTFGVCLAVFAASGAILWLLIAVETIPIRMEAQWRTNFVPMSLGGMDLPLPAVILIGAARDAKVENHKIKIHELRQGYATLDPILEIDGKFVLVWDENGKIIPPPS